MTHTPILTKVAALFLILAAACQAPTSVSPAVDADAGVSDDDKASWRRTFYITLAAGQTEYRDIRVGCWDRTGSVARVQAIASDGIRPERRASVGRIEYIGAVTRQAAIIIRGKDGVQTQRKFEINGTGLCTQFYQLDYGVYEGLR